MEKLDELFMPVTKMPSNLIAPGYDFPSGLSHAIVVDTPEGKRVVNYCSDIYHLVPNEFIFNKFNREIIKYFDVDINYSMRDYAKFRINFLIKQKPLFFNKRDLIFPTLSMVNSYDSSRKFSFILGFQRMICTNGMMAPVGDNPTELKFVHTPQLGEETTFDEVMQMLSLFMANASELLDQYEELAYQGVKNVESRVEDVIEDTSFPSNLVEDVLYRIDQERLALDMKDFNDWLVYCGFNYQLNHNLDFKAKDQRKESIDREVFKYLTTY